MNALVTAIGSMSAECVIDSLRGIGIGVVGTDIYPREYHPVVNRCLEFQKVPKVVPDENAYCKAILDVAIKGNCKVIIPLTDPEVDILSVNRQRFDDVGIKICLADDNVIQNARNKNIWCKKLSNSKSVKIIPSYDSFSELKSAYSGEFVAKRVNGRSSEGILFANTSSFNDSCNYVQNYIFQPRIEGDILTVDFVRHPKSRELVFVPRIELMRTKNGAGTVVKIARQEFCKEVVFEVVEALDLSGVMNCEFICAEDGLYLMDINPRFSAGVSFSKMAGYDFVAANIKCYLENSVDKLASLNENHVYVKRFCDF